MRRQVLRFVDDKEHALQTATTNIRQWRDFQMIGRQEILNLRRCRGIGISGQRLLHHCHVVVQWLHVRIKLGLNITG